MCELDVDENEVYIIIYYYDLELGTEGIKQSVHSASSHKFNVNIPKNKNKTLYEIEIYKNPYPDYKRKVNFILYDTEEKNINPLKIDFKNNVKHYENFDIENLNQTVEYDILNGINLPCFKDKTITAEKVSLQIEYDDYKNEIKGHLNQGKILISEPLYFDLDNRVITKDSLFKLNQIALPVEKFKLTINFEGIGQTYANLQIEINCINKKIILGECKEAIFCFQ